MLIRNILLALGVLCVLAGAVVLVALFNQARNAPHEVVKTRVETPVSVVVAAKAIPKGTLLREVDLKSKDLGPNENLQPGSIASGQEREFLGALSRRDFAEGEPLVASDFIKASDRNFLAAVLKSGYRAISISVDTAQSVAGLALPDDYVDVILIQSFDDKIDPRHRTVGETVLHGVRVIAVDQSLTPPHGVAAAVSSANAEAAIPRTVTLEVIEQQAEKLLVASKLGTFQLSLLPLNVAVAETPEDQRDSKPVWASDVSQAINEIGTPPPPPAVVAAPSLPLPPPPPAPCPPVTGSTLDKLVRCASSNTVYYHAPANTTPEAAQTP